MDPLTLVIILFIVMVLIGIYILYLLFGMYKENPNYFLNMWLVGPILHYMIKIFN